MYTALLVLAALAWVLSDVRMSGMGGGPSADLGTLGWFLATWVVMMTAMMFPSVGPMVVMVRDVEGRTLATATFVAGYLLVWSAAGAAAYAVVRLGARWDVLSWDRAGRWLASAALLAAAAYEVSPWKHACLRRCRSPFSFLVTSWRPGLRGAVRMGTRHGAWCLGCCWGLMAALFALGVMSLAWMAVVSALIAIEKLLPWRRVGVAVTTATLLLLGIGVAVAPGHVPGLQRPSPSMSSM